MKRFKKTISNARKCRHDGFLFDSILERDRYILLKQEEKKGLISQLKLQVPFDLIPTQQRNDNKVPSISKTEKIRATKYIADFVYLRNLDKKWIINDAKGRTMEVYKLKLKLVILNYCSGQGFTFLETYRDSKRNNFQEL